MSLADKALKEVDAYPTSAVQNKFQGSTKYRTNFGGILSIVAVAALVGLTIPHVNSSFFPTQKGVARVLAESTAASNPSAEFGPGYYSDINLRFQSQFDADLYETIPTNPYNAKSSGIQKLSIALTDEAERTLLQKETALMQTQGISNSSSIAKYIYDSRTSDVKKAKKDWMEYISFQQTNIYLRGTSVANGGGEAETDIEFKQYKTYEASEFVMDKYNLFPTLDITDNVNVMGDMMNQDTQLMKAYSSFEIQINYYELAYESQDVVDDIIKDMEKKNDINIEKIPAWPQPSSKSYHDSRFDEMVEDFHNDYTGPYDATFRSKLADYKDTINELIGIEEGGNYFEPPLDLENADFWSDIKAKAKTSISMVFTDPSISTKDKSFDLLAWVKYFSFDSPDTESPPFLFGKLTEIVNHAYSGQLSAFITKVGSKWNASALTEFFLTTSPTNVGLYTCGGSPDEPYHGLTAGYALSEFTSTTLSACSQNCVNHNPNKCEANKPCAYTTSCGGFYFWNMEVNRALGIANSASSGYNENLGRCILVDTTISNDQCSAADKDDTTTQEWNYLTIDNTVAAALLPRLKSSDEFALESYSFTLDWYFWKAETIVQCQAASAAPIKWAIDWWSLLQGIMRNKLEKIQQGLESKKDSVFRKGYFDSAKLKIQYDFDTYEHSFGQTPLSFDCIKASTGINLNPSMSRVPCYKFGNLVVFKLNENYVQDIYNYYSKEYVVNEQRSLGNKLVVDKILQNDFTTHVIPPYIGKRGYDFNTLWRIDFTMSPSKTVNNQMWFVQNPDEPRTTTQLYALEQAKVKNGGNVQSSTQVTGNVLAQNNSIQSIQWFELMAYVGGMWFIISKLMSMGTKLMNTNYKTLNFELESFEQKTEVKKVSPSDLEGGEQEKLSKKQKLAKLLDEILTPEQRVRLNSKMNA